MSESVTKSQKTAQDNAQLMQTLLVGMENLGENVKQLASENMDYWKITRISRNAQAEHHTS